MPTMTAFQHSFLLFVSLTVLLVTCTTVTAQCNLIGPAVIKGKKFFDSRSGRYIPLKGIAYYPRPNAGTLSEGKNRDFFGEEYRDIWERDIAYFQQLSINVVRIYAVDPGLDHSGFMCALQQAGIYAIIGLAASCEDCAVTGMQAPDCYPAALKERGQFVINIFAKYENVLAFCAGNEVLLYAPGQPPEYNGPCQKQFLRDMRAYIDSCPNLRKIPVGVAVADFDRDEQALYYNCRSDPNDTLENAEWYGLNVYQHCDPTAQTVDDLKGFQGLLESHRNYSMSIPVVLSEYGCMNEGFPTIDGFEGQRDFLQVDAIYSQEYQEYFAGGVVFEYSAEKFSIDDRTPYEVPYPFAVYSRYRFGVGYYAPEECNDENITCTYVPYPEFDILAARYAAVDDSSGPTLDSYNPGTLDVTQCPSNFPPLNTFTWESDSTEDLECVGPNYVFICPNTAPDCLPPFAVSGNSPPPATPPAPTAAPSNAASSTVVPTLVDCQEAYSLWFDCALGAGCSLCGVDQDPPNLLPGESCSDVLLWLDERSDCCETCSTEILDFQECKNCPATAPTAVPSVASGDSTNDTSSPSDVTIDTVVPSVSPTVATEEESPTIAPTEETPAPSRSSGSTTSAPVLFAQPVELAPTNKIVAETSSSARDCWSLVWLWSSASVMLLLVYS